MALRPDHLRRIRIIRTADVSGTDIGNLTYFLNTTQDYFTFEPDGQARTQPVARGGGHLLETDREARRSGDSQEPALRRSDFTILVTGQSLEDGDLSDHSLEHRMVVISIAGWEQFAAVPLVDGLAYLVATVLMDIGAGTGAHRDRSSQSCPNDALGDLRNIRAGMASGEFCQSCEALIRTSLLPRRARAAVRRILDRVAGRRVAFVAIPADRETTRIRKAIQSAGASTSVSILRADPTLDPRETHEAVVECLERCHLVIADLTGRPPSVYYELGYANARGREVVVITFVDSERPFEIAASEAVAFRDADDLERRLTDVLSVPLSTS